MGGAKLKTKY
jgi:hypothetical protein